MTIHTKPLVSILIPAYNHERYIEECIRSIAEQTYENIELIVIDDGSTDGTWEKIKKIQSLLHERFTKMLCFHQENMGTSGTVAKLRELSTGDYITPIASDDRMKPTMISALMTEILKDNSYGLVVGDSEIIDNDSNRVYWDKNQKIQYDSASAVYTTFGAFLKNQRKDIDFNSEEFGSYLSLLRGNYIPNGFIVKASLYRSKDVFNPDAPLEDWFAMMQLSKMTKMKFIDEVVSSYRWHDNNAIKDNKKISAYRKKTLAFEINFVMMGTDATLKQFVMYDFYGEKTLLHLGGIVRLSKRKGLKYKTLTLSMQNKKIFSISYKYRKAKLS